MLTQEKLVEIHVLHRQGMSIRRIAKELNLSRNTVRCYLRDQARISTYGPRQQRPSKLDAYKPYLQGRIEAAKPDWIPATVLFREIQALGYPGQAGILKNYLRQFKSTIIDEPVIRFETEPGHHLQTIAATVIPARS